MAFYIKITKKVADKIGAPVDDRNKTADGNILLWQADLDGVQGDTIFERAAFVGGAVLTPIEAKGESDGSTEPVNVYVPDYFEDKEPLENTTEKVNTLE